MPLVVWLVKHLGLAFATAAGFLHLFLGIIRLRTNVQFYFIKGEIACAKCEKSRDVVSSQILTVKVHWTS